MITNVVHKNRNTLDIITWSVLERLIDYNKVMLNANISRHPFLVMLTSCDRPDMNNTLSVHSFISFPPKNAQQVPSKRMCHLKNRIHKQLHSQIQTGNDTPYSVYQSVFIFSWDILETVSLLPTILSMWTYEKVCKCRGTVWPQTNAEKVHRSEMAHSIHSPLPSIEAWQHYSKTYNSSI